MARPRSVVGEIDSASRIGDDDANLGARTRLHGHGLLLLRHIARHLRLHVPLRLAIAALVPTHRGCLREKRNQRLGGGRPPLGWTIPSFVHRSHHALAFKVGTSRSLFACLAARASNLQSPHPRCLAPWPRFAQAGALPRSNPLRSSVFASLCCTIHAAPTHSRTRFNLAPFLRRRREQAHSSPAFDLASARTP